MTLGQNSVIPQFKGGNAEGVKKCKNCFFLSPSIENSKLNNIPENEFLGTIRRGDMRGFPLFDLETGYSFRIPPPNLDMELKFGTVYLIGILYLPFWDFDFLASLNLSTRNADQILFFF